MPTNESDIPRITKEDLQDPDLIRFNRVIRRLAGSQSSLVVTEESSSTDRSSGGGSVAQQTIIATVPDDETVSINDEPVIY